ncbi:MAG: hypothetical protein K0S46_515 [Moraxellaceae bacterium]|jgi:hypothetical protein|nr:hypothetical protein [Moraxellaceae bacterium]
MAERLLVLVMLAAALLSAPAAALDDTDLLYCAQVHAEAGRVFDQAGGTEEARQAGHDAQRRAVALDERAYDLLNESPQRHSRAMARARQRFAALPAAPPVARNLALRAAYEQCREREERLTTAPAARVEMLGKRRFCRDLMQRTGERSAALRQQFGEGERAALDELLAIVDTLSRPLPGRSVTPDEDREANQLLAQRRAELDQAVAAWKSGPGDPMVKALNQCHEEYAQGLLGGPDRGAPAPTASAAPVPAADAPVEAAAPGLPAGPPVDLGAVFHMRELARGGNYEGLWRRSDFPNVYDAYWIHLPTGQVLKDVIEVRGIEDGELVLYRRVAGGHYRAPLRADGRLATGTASWASRAAFRWMPLPAQDARYLGRSLGPVVHVRETTPAGDYDAIWRRRGKTNVYDAFWVHGPSGETVADVVVVTGLRQGHVELERPALRATYRAPVQRDGRVKGGWAVHGDGAPRQWVVLPAQAVSLPAMPGAALTE